MIHLRSPRDEAPAPAFDPLLQVFTTFPLPHLRGPKPCLFKARCSPRSVQCWRSASVPPAGSSAARALQSAPGPLDGWSGKTATKKDLVWCFRAGGFGSWPVSRQLFSRWILFGWVMNLIKSDPYDPYSLLIHVASFPTSSACPTQPYSTHPTGPGANHESRHVPAALRPCQSQRPLLGARFQRSNCN